MNEPLDITTLTLEQLKALAYDQLVIREQAQANLTALNAEIQKRNGAKETIPT